MWFKYLNTEHGHEHWISRLGYVELGGIRFKEWDGPWSFYFLVFCLVCRMKQVIHRNLITYKLIIRYAWGLINGLILSNFEGWTSICTISSSFHRPNTPLAFSATVIVSELPPECLMELQNVRQFTIDICHSLHDDWLAYWSVEVTNWNSVTFAFAN